MLQVTRKLALFLLIIFALFLIAQPAFAQDRWGIELFRGRPEFVEAPGGVASVIVNIVMWLMSMVALLSLGFIVWAAIRYVTSAGHEQMITQAKRTLFWAIIGLMIAILAIVIVQVVARVVERGEMECQTDADCGTGNSCCKLSEGEGVCACWFSPCTPPYEPCSSP